MKSLFLFAALLTSSSISATEIELNIPGGNFEDCEFVDLGQEGSVTGTMLIKSTDKDNRWAGMVGLTLVDDSEPLRVFRFSFQTVANAKHLIIGYEFLNGNEKLVSETIARTTIGQELAYSFSWNEHGAIKLSIGESSPRLINVAIKPKRSFIVISGANAKATTAGKERIDCSRSLMPVAAKDV